MTRQPRLAARAEELLGCSVVATSPVAGGDTSRSTKLRLSDGRVALMKTQPQAPDDFFAAEARGLRWLAEAADGVPVPEVLADDPGCVILRWVEPGRANAEAAVEFGRALARTHAAGAETFGAAEDGYIGTLPLPNRSCETWPEFYAVRRVLPYLKLGRDRGAVSASDAAAVEAVIGKLPSLLPEEPPARLHGDLWNGNVLWGQDGSVRMLDPAAYGGMREVDLAMLSLFGLPHLPKVIDGYTEEHPLAEGWEDRIGLHQLFPLLVHAALFGGGYGARAAAIAERYT